MVIEDLTTTNLLAQRSALERVPLANQNPHGHTRPLQHGIPRVWGSSHLLEDKEGSVKPRSAWVKHGKLTKLKIRKYELDATDRCNSLSLALHPLPPP
eukprot:9410904-Pyramimonas_sp.AAC.1